MNIPEPDLEKILLLAPSPKPPAGLKESLPEKDIAVTIVGEAKKFIVSRLPSLRALKFLDMYECRCGAIVIYIHYRLKEVSMA